MAPPYKTNLATKDFVTSGNLSGATYVINFSLNGSNILTHSAGLEAYWLLLTTSNQSTAALVTAEMKVTEGAGLINGGYDNSAARFYFKKVNGQMVMCLQVGSTKDVGDEGYGPTYVEQPCPWAEDSYVNISFGPTPTGLHIGYRIGNSGSYKEIMRLDRGDITTSSSDPWYYWTRAGYSRYGGIAGFTSDGAIGVPSGTPQYKKCSVWRHAVRSDPFFNGAPNTPTNVFSDNFNRANGAYNSTTASGYNGSYVTGGGTSHSIVGNTLGCYQNSSAPPSSLGLSAVDGSLASLPPKEGVGVWVYFTYNGPGSTRFQIIAGEYWGVWLNTNLMGSTYGLVLTTGPDKYETYDTTSATNSYQVAAVSAGTRVHLIVFPAPVGTAKGLNPIAGGARVYLGGSTSMPTYASSPTVFNYGNNVGMATRLTDVAFGEWLPNSGVQYMEDLSINIFNVASWVGSGSAFIPMQDGTSDSTLRLVPPADKSVVIPYLGTKMAYERIEAGT